MADQKDELAAEQTAGFKVGKQTTLEELNQLDQGDESLNRWKASLLGENRNATGQPTGKPTFHIVELALLSNEIDDIVINLEGGDVAAKLKDRVIKIKEGATFQMRVKFKVSGGIISGIKYVQVVKRAKINVNKTQEMLGSYAPNTEKEPVYIKTLSSDEAPSGMIARATYKATIRFVDDDNHTHLQFDWAFEIAKTW